MPFIASTIMKQPPGRHADSGGLYLEVKAAEGARKAVGRYWMFRYRDGSAVRWKSLGVFPNVTLAMAREKARRWREELYHGRDPFKAAAVPTFAAAADSFLAVNASGWSNVQHRKQWVATLGDAYCASLRPLPVDVIETRHVLDVLAPIWHVKPETARRLRGRIEAVLDYAKSKGWRTGENPARWRGCLKGPLSNVRRERKHHAALPFDRVPAFVATLQTDESFAAKALEFIILTAARLREALDARWPEIDLAQATWTVPASRMKARRDHVVPLSTRVLELLRPLNEIRTVGDFVFPGPPSESAVRRLLIVGSTVHGFRSSFSDWAGERTTFQSEVIEFALAHSIPDRAKAAYRRYRALEKRRELMESWARYCDGASNVVLLRMLS